MRRLQTLILLLFGLDRLWKSVLIAHFFRRMRPAAPNPWPSVTIIQPVTRGASRLEQNLRARLQLAYDAPVQHVIVCDRADAASQAICRAVCAEFPGATTEILLAEASVGEIASKIEKMQTALTRATGDVLLFVDDDVMLRPDALRVLLPYLEQPDVGAAFGLACYSNWRNLWSGLMSAFVNANALMSYIPLCYLTDPYTITGHCFALRRSVFEAVGGFGRMENRLDDDHELARRLRRHGLRSVQTPLIYDVDNDLPTARAYFRQMQRWFVFPRLMVAPYLTRREALVTGVGSVGTMLPPLLTGLALLGRNRHGGRCLALMVALLLVSYCWGERYLGRRTPPERLLLVPLIAVLAPLQIVWGLLAGDEVQWRGQRLQLDRHGMVKRVL